MREQCWSHEAWGRGGWGSPRVVPGPHVPAALAAGQAACSLCRLHGMWGFAQRPSQAQGQREQRQRHCGEPGRGHPALTHVTPTALGTPCREGGGLATLWLQVPVASWLFCPVVGLLGAHGALWLWVQGGKGSGHSAWRERRHGAGPMLWGAVGIGGALGVPSAVSLAVCGARCGAGCGASCRRMVGRSCWQRGRGCISPCGGGAALILLGGAGAAAPWHSRGSQRAEHRCWHGTVRSWCSVWDPMAMLLRAVN